MHELELAGHPEIDSKRRSHAGRMSSSRTPFVVSIVVHAVAAYALLLHPLAEVPAPPRTVADYFVFELPTPPPVPIPAPEEVPVAETAPVEPPVEELDAEPPPTPAAEEPVERAIVGEPTAPTSEAQPAAIAEAEPAASDEVSAEEAAPPTAPPPFVDFSEESRRAAREVVTERSAENEYLTFTMDDLVPPRAEPEERPKRSIFDGGGGPDFGRRSVGTLGQQRTRVGRKLAEICNALTGGFGVSFFGFGLFSACASPDTGPSGLFPEVRPAYLDLMPECVDTRDTAPALALEAPFPTVKCRLVKQEPEE